MVVETFVQEETPVPPTREYAAAEREQMIALCAELCLDRQRELHEPKVSLVVAETGVATVSPFKYRPMTEGEALVYGILCPTHEDLKDYQTEALPLRVLEVLRDARTHFEKFEVWHAAEVVKDPVLVGVKKNPQRTWEERRYILARWGDVLEAFPLLAEKTLTIVRARAHRHFTAMKQAIDADLTMLKDLSVDVMLDSAASVLGAVTRAANLHRLFKGDEYMSPVS